MAGSLNKVMLIGHLGRDPEVRSTQDGREIATLSLATGESWKDKSTGERKEKTEWHRVVIFAEGLVRVVKDYARKGSRLYVEGKLQTRKWTDKDGVEKYATEIVVNGFADRITLLDRRESSDGEAVGATGASAEPLDDEIPF